MDTLTENSVQVALDRLGAQRTVLVIAHRLGTSKSLFVLIIYVLLWFIYFNALLIPLIFLDRFKLVRNADKIIVLKDGRAYEEGTHDELLLKNGLYSEMWNMQLHSSSTSTSQSNLLSV